MSPLKGAVGAGAILALIAHESSLAREAERLEAQRQSGQEEAILRERLAREDRLRELRGITNARLHNLMMQRGVMPMHTGRGAGAVYLSEMANRSLSPEVL